MRAFYEKNKMTIIMVVLGAIVAVLLNWLDFPIWLIGGLIAGTAELAAKYAVKYVDMGVSRIDEKVAAQKSAKANEVSDAEEVNEG